MPVRGSRSIYPAEGRIPTGIFSTRGSQKKDSTSEFPNQVTQRYAHSDTTSKPKGGGKGNSSGCRHQKPKKIW